MKKWITAGICLAAVCALAATACGNTQQNTTAGETEAAEQTVEQMTEEKTGTTVEEEPATQAVTGGWSVNTETASAVTQEQAALFETALDNYLGVDYEPVAVIASQVVAGTHYAYLCKGTAVVPDAETDWYIVVVYADPGGGVQVISAEDLDITDLHIAEDAGEALTGAFAAVEPEKESGLPDDAKAAFGKAKDTFTDISYMPFALLGTQVVSGTNYRFLCAGASLSQEPSLELYVVDIYEDLQGGAQVSDAGIFDLDAYVNLMEQPEEETEETQTENEELPAADWEVVTEAGANLSDEEMNIFNRAMEKMPGIPYFPVAMVAVHADSATDYAYLCRDSSDWYFITVSTDADQNADCVGITVLDLMNLSVLPDAMTEGVWDIGDFSGNSGSLPAAVQDAFAQAAEGYGPVALLGRQTGSVGGYKILCSSLADHPAGLYVVTIRQDAEGNAEIEQAECLDLTQYIGQFY